MNRKVLLVVEDNPDDEALVRRALKKASVDCDIVVVRDGAEAVEYLLGNPAEARSKPPELVLLDLKTPRMDGFDVLRRIRGEDRTRATPVVVFTSSSEERDKQRSYDLGANAYVRKPIEAERFAQTVRDLAAFWIGLNEVSPQNPGIGVARRSILP